MLQMVKCTALSLLFVVAFTTSTHLPDRNLGLPSTSATGSGHILSIIIHEHPIPYDVLDVIAHRLDINTLSSISLTCKTFRAYQKSCIQTVFEGEYAPFLCGLNFDDDDFRQSAAAFFEGLDNDLTLKTALSAFSPEQIINLYDGARFCDEAEMFSTSLVDRIIYDLNGTDAFSLISGLDMARVWPYVSDYAGFRKQRILSGIDKGHLLPIFAELPYHNYYSLDDLVWLFQGESSSGQAPPKEIQSQVIVLTDVRCLLSLLLCGIRFDILEFAEHFNFSVDLLREIYPFLERQCTSRLSWVHWFWTRLSNELSDSGENNMKRLFNVIIQIPELRSMLAASPAQFYYLGFDSKSVRLFKFVLKSDPALMISMVNEGVLNKHSGDTLLHRACSTSSPKFLELLFSVPGIKFNRRNRAGQLPIESDYFHPKEIVKDIPKKMLKGLIGSDPLIFLNKLAEGLKVTPDPAIISMIGSDRNLFIDKFCSIIEGHGLKVIGLLLCDFKLFTRNHFGKGFVGCLRCRDLPK